MSPSQRLAAILGNRRLTAHHPYWSAGDPAICFTEATYLGLERLVQRGRYAPWGVGFEKNRIFREGGGPAFYVRGDHWDAFRQSNLPSQQRALATPFWPGADPAANAQALPPHLSTPSQWFHEREWRMPRTGGQQDFNFVLDDVRVLVVPDDAGLDWLIAEVPDLAAHINHIQVMRIAAPAQIVEEEDLPEYDWTDPYDPANPYADVVKEMLGLD